MEGLGGKAARSVLIYTGWRNLFIPIPASEILNSLGSLLSELLWALWGAWLVLFGGGFGSGVNISAYRDSQIKLCTRNFVSLLLFYDTVLP